MGPRRPHPEELPLRGAAGAGGPPGLLVLCVIIAISFTIIIIIIFITITK